MQDDINNIIKEMQAAGFDDNKIKNLLETTKKGIALDINYSDIQEDNTLAIAQKHANGDCSSPLEGKVKKQKPDRSILWTALAINLGDYLTILELMGNENAR